MKKLSKITFSEDSTSATVKVQVGSVETLVSFSEDNGDFSIDIGDKLRMLEEAGMSLDFLTLLAEYKELFKNRDVILLEQKRAKYRKIYRDLWVFQTKDIEIDGVDFSWESEKDFIDRKISDLWAEFRGLKVTYKSIVVDVRAKTTSRDWSGNGGLTKYSIDGKITDYKSRNYSTLKACINKIVELVDESILYSAIQKDTAKKALLARKAKLKILNDAIDLEVVYKSEYTSSYRGRGVGFYVDTYSVEVNGQKVRVNVDRDTMKIFNFGSFTNLTVDQVNSIISLIK